MIVKTFGIWRIESRKGLIGFVDSSWHYPILRHRLWEYRGSEGNYTWDWMIHLTEKNWFTEPVADDFNKAFAFAQEHFKHLKPKNIPDVSMEYSISVQKSYMSKKNIKSLVQIFPNLGK